MLLQAEQMHKIISISLKMVEVVILSEIVVILSVAITIVIFFSAWDKSRVKWDNSLKPTQKYNRGPLRSVWLQQLKPECMTILRFVNIHKICFYNLEPLD